jgi:hypothetical protein
MIVSVEARIDTTRRPCVLAVVGRESNGPREGPWLRLRSDRGGVGIERATRGPGYYSLSWWLQGRRALPFEC